jgi:peroxiredoxin
MKLRYFVLIIGLLLILVACKKQEPENGGGYTPPPVGGHMQMVPFKLTNLTDNTELDSKQLEGQVLVVTFFATWCPPCIQEIPTFIDLQDSYKEKGFSIVAFSMDQGSQEQVRDFIKKHGIHYPVLPADDALAKGFGGVTGIPVTFVVNRKGEIVKKYLGYIEHATLENEIKSLLSAE